MLPICSKFANFYLLVLISAIEKHIMKEKYQKVHYTKQWHETGEYEAEIEQ